MHGQCVDEVVSGGMLSLTSLRVLLVDYIFEAVTYSRTMSFVLSFKIF